MEQEQHVASGYGVGLSPLKQSKATNSFHTETPLACPSSCTFYLLITAPPHTHTYSLIMVPMTSFGVMYCYWHTLIHSHSDEVPQTDYRKHEPPPEILCKSSVREHIGLREKLSGLHSDPQKNSWPPKWRLGWERKIKGNEAQCQH